MSPTRRADSPDAMSKPVFPDVLASGSLGSLGTQGDRSDPPTFSLLTAHNNGDKFLCVP
jgi:hypothetical protein